MSTVKMRRKHWTAEDQEWIAHFVARKLHQGWAERSASQGIAAIESHMMVPLREAVSLMAEEKRRKIGGPSQVPWLAERVQQALDAMMAGTLVPEDEDQAESEPEPYFSGPPLLPGALPAGHVAVPVREFRRLRREVIRLRRERLETNQRLDHLADNLDTLIELWQETVPSRSVAAEVCPAIPENATVCGPSLPLIVVVGIRPRDEAYLVERVGHLAEIILVDPRRKSPREAGACDWLIVTRLAGDRWYKDARRLYDGQVSRANNTASIVAEVHRLCSGRLPGAAEAL